MQETVNFVYDTYHKVPERCINGKLQPLCMQGYHLSLESFCRFGNLQTKAFYLSKNDILPDNFLYPVHATCICTLLENVNSLSDFLPDQIIVALKQKKCTLVLLDWHECCNMHMIPGRRRNIINFATKYKIDTKQILYIHNAAKTSIYSTHGFNDNLNLISIGVNFFALTARVKLYSEKVNVLHKKRLNQLIKNIYFNNYFLCLNRVPRTHRCWFVYELWKRNLLNNKKVLCSFTASFNEINDLHDESIIPRDDYNKLTPFINFIKKQTTNFEGADDQKDFFSFLNKEESKSYLAFCKTLPYYIDTNRHEHNHWNTFNEQIFLESGIFLVTETLFFKKSSYSMDSFLTEKTFKPILYQMPFIVLSHAKTLYSLKELGFRTFGKYWDERYDDELDDEKRLYKVVNLVNDICNMSQNKFNQMLQNMYPDLLYNYNLLMSLNTQDLLINVIKNI